MFSFYCPNVPIDLYHFNVYIVGLKTVKEERQDLNEVDEKHQDQKDRVNGEKSVSCSIQTTDVKRPISCSQCGKSFTRNESLKDHMLIHAGIKPYSCSQCGKSFTQKGSLMRHMRIHSEEKPFTCSQCGKSFTQKGQLENHLVSHTAKKAFQLFSMWKRFQTETTPKESHENS